MSRTVHERESVDFYRHARWYDREFQTRLAHLGDFADEPLTPDSEMQVLVCRRS